MSDIRYVVLSDLHFGAAASLLTNLSGDGRYVDAQRPSAVLVALVDALRSLVGQNTGGEPPVLVLNGDVLDYAFSEVHVAAMAFEQFVIALYAEGREPVANDILFVPGNHDHHLWEKVRERHYLDYLACRPVGEYIDPPVHVTALFTDDPAEMMDSKTLTALIRRNPSLGDVTVRVAYPNLGLTTSSSDRVVVLHHGHYGESHFQVLSALSGLLHPDRPPVGTVAELEAHNFAWIDFVWSLLGRSAAAGGDLMSLYDFLESDERADELVGMVASTVVSRRTTGVRKAAETWALKQTLNQLVQRYRLRERNNRAVALTDHSRESFRAYIEGPMWLQLQDEGGGELPHDLTLIFGHTHKPLEERWHLRNYPGPVAVYNTGGWVVDASQPTPVKGAAVMLLDEELHAASLRIFDDVDGLTRPRIQTVSDDPTGHEWADQLTERLERDSDVWSDLSSAVAADVPERRRHARERLNQR